MSAVEVRDSRQIKAIKTALERDGMVEIVKQGDFTVVRTTLTRDQLPKEIRDGHVVRDYHIEPKEKGLRGYVSQYLGPHKRLHELLKKTPRKWSFYEPMVLFNSDTFDAIEWTRAFESIDKEDFCRYLLEYFPGATHIAINKPIEEFDEMRRPFHLVPFYGNFGPELRDGTPRQQDFQQAFWCTVIQNGIYQTWAPRYTMFSRGNIKEKRRLLDTFPNMDHQYVVDMYAGIGYFTLSYLANGATVFCWEINPWSIEGLARGVTKNGHKYMVTLREQAFTREIFFRNLSAGVRVFIFAESNDYATMRLSPLALHISHINLGLLPSSQQSWPAARGLSSSTVIHVHENVHINDIERMRQQVEEYFGKVVHVEKVKTYAPDVWHIVFDTQTRAHQSS